MPEEVAGRTGEWERGGTADVLPRSSSLPSFDARLRPARSVSGRTGASAGRTGASAGRIRLTRIDLLMLLLVLIWGLNFIVVKVALRSFTPLAFNALRFGLATVIMLAIMRVRRESFALNARDLLFVTLLGLGGHTLYQWLFIHGLTRTSPGNTSLLMATSPIFVAVFGHLLGAERGNRAIWAGIAVSFAGVLLLVLGGRAGLSMPGGATVGDLMVLGASMLWAAYTVASKPLLRRHSPIKLTTLSMVAGVPPLVLLGVSDLAAQDWGALPAGPWLGVVYSGLLSVAVGYVAWSISVQRVGNARTAVYSNVTPVVTIIAAWLLLGDLLAPLQALGGLVVLAGLLLTRRGRMVSAEPRPEPGD